MENREDIEEIELQEDDIEEYGFVFKYNEKKICSITIIQFPDFALNSITLSMEKRLPIQ